MWHLIVSIPDLCTLTYYALKFTHSQTCYWIKRSVSLGNMCKECVWAPLSQRSQQHKRSLMYTVNNGMVPSYIQDLILPLVSKTSDHPLRNNRNIFVPLYRTSISHTLVFHHPLGYDILLKITLKMYQHYPPLKSI